MGFLDWFKSAPKREPGIIELRLDGVGPFLERKAEEKSNVLEKEVPAKFSEIKHLIVETEALLKDLDKTEISDAGNKRFRKAARTAKKDSIQKVNAVLHKIQPPFTSDAEGVRTYCIESLALLQEKIRSSSKSLAYTSMIVKDVMREIGKKIDSLERVFKSLVGTIKENEVLFEKSKLLSLVSGIKADKEALVRTESELAEMRKALEAVATERESMQARLDKVLASEENAGLRGLEERRRQLLLEKIELRNQLINTVAGMSRPLKKLENLVSRRKHFLERDSEQAMGLFLGEPAALFKQDPKGNSFKKLLRELKGTLAAEKLGLKAREREKKLAEIDSLLEFDFFTNFFWKENGIEKEVREIEASEGKIEIKAQIDGIRSSLSGLDHDFNEISAAVRELERRAGTHSERTRASLVSLGETLSEMANQKIRIVDAMEKAGTVEDGAK